MENLLIYAYKYFWVVLIIMLLLLGVIMIVLGSINKHKLVKKEREKHSELLKMSYNDDNAKSKAKHLDEETPKNKKYCPLCHSLINKKDKVCPVCKNEFKD